MINQNLLLAGDDGYNLTKSLRFRSSASAYLNRTPASAGSSTKMTFSFWTKRGQLSKAFQNLFTSGASAGNGDATIFTSGDAFRFWLNGGSASDITTSQVFRDPSAWYHIVIAIDTTQATASNRVLIYVNGTQVTAFSSVTYPNQNYAVQYFNTTTQQQIGYGVTTGNGGNYYDGYQTEINFIDGQQLTPSSFGSTNALTGVWQPAKYTGTYGTNGFYLPFVNQSSATYAGGFNGSSQQLVTSTNSSLALGTSDFTVEYWVYFNATTGGQVPVAAGNGTFGYDPLFGYYDTGNQFVLYLSSNGTTWGISSGKLIGTISPSQWHHVAITRSGNTFYTFLNGVQGSTFTSSSSIYQSANSFAMGRAAGNYSNCSLSNVRVLVGTALYTSNFTVPTSNLTAITNTKLLTLQNATIVDNSTNALTFTNTGSVVTSLQNPFAGTSVTSDQSGNANNWIGNNINVATTGTTYDSMTDVPTLTSATTANYCVLNPIFNVNGTNVTYSNGNLTFSHPASSGNAQLMAIRGTIAFPAGKYYWEYTVGATVNDQVGIGNNVALGGSPDGTAGARYIYNGTFQSNYTNPSSAANYTTGDVIGMAYDQPNGTLAFYKNNSLQGTITAISTTETFFPMRSPGSSGTGGAGSFNFGQQGFTYTPPTGFVALNTYNLPTSTIVKGNTVMDVSLYTGNATSQNVTNAGFKPDLVWGKDRTNIANHGLVDSVRGVSTWLGSNSTAAENTVSASYVTAFNSNGFTAGLGGVFNASGDNYVAWQWQAGQGSSSSNTSGTRTSTVSVNASAGFSVVTFNSGSAGNQSFGHGLGVTPAFFVIKSRASSHWDVWHQSFSNPATNYMYLNLTNAVASDARQWANTAPNSTVISYESGYEFAANTNFVAYCWSEIAGFSKFGSYTGNGSTDGPFIYCGFRPKFILVKNTGSGGYNWRLTDTSRSTYNQTVGMLEPSSSSSEYTDSGNWDFDILSNGFKCRNTGGSNVSGGTQIYMAFAENPFKNALAR